MSFGCTWSVKAKCIHNVRYSSASASTRESCRTPLVVSTPVLTSWLRSRHKYNRHSSACLFSMQGVPCKLPGETPAGSPPTSCCVLLIALNPHLSHAETTPKCQGYPRTSMQSHMLRDVDLTPSTKSADSLKYNMATGFTGWCSHKAEAYSSPGKILPAELFQLTRSMSGASEKHRHNFSPASAQRQKIRQICIKVHHYSRSGGIDRQTR